MHIINLLDLSQHVFLEHFLGLVTNADGSCGGEVLSAVCLCLFVCFPNDILKTDAAL